MPLSITKGANPWNQTTRLVNPEWVTPLTHFARGIASRWEVAYLRHSQAGGFVANGSRHWLFRVPLLRSYSSQ